ncbi:MAG: DNA polymerase III subunit beta [Thermoleophilia bacterium]|nr:DNA polymerase III subunit beta [Thermoleophilia bacterium]
MRLVSQKDHLAGRLAAVGRAASNKSTVPTLSHVLITAEADRVEVAATDMEISLRAPLEARVDAPGAIVVPRLAADIVRSMVPGEVTLEHNEGEGTLSLSGGSSSFTLNCLQASDFPALPTAAPDGITLPADVFTSTTERVARAASRDDTRPVLTGVLVRIGPDDLTMVATDSYRLAVRQAAITGGPAEPVQALVPARALAEAQRAIALADADEIQVGLGDSTGTFRAGDVVLTTRLIDGQFPDYRQLIPTEFTHDLELDRGELLSVLGRIAVIAQRNTPVRVSLADGAMTLSVVSEQLGEGRESIPVAFSGEPMDVGFNVEFLRAGVESVEDETLRLGLISPLRPGLLRAGDESFRYLLMPIRLNG